MFFLFTNYLIMSCIKTIFTGIKYHFQLYIKGDRRGRDRMVVRFTTCAISAYHQ